MSQDNEFNQVHGLEGHWRDVLAAEGPLLTACGQHTSKYLDPVDRENARSLVSQRAKQAQFSQDTPRNRARKERDAAILDLRQQGHTFLEISTAVGLSVGGVTAVCKRDMPIELEEHICRKHFLDRRPRKRSMDTNGRILELRKDGLPWARIASIVGVSDHAVSRACKRYLPAEIEEAICRKNGRGSNHPRRLLSERSANSRQVRPDENS